MLRCLWRTFCETKLILLKDGIPLPLNKIVPDKIICLTFFPPIPQFIDGDFYLHVPFPVDV